MTCLFLKSHGKYQSLFPTVEVLRKAGAFSLSRQAVCPVFCSALISRTLTFFSLVIFEQDNISEVQFLTLGKFVFFVIHEKFISRHSEVTTSNSRDAKIPVCESMYVNVCVHICEGTLMIHKPSVASVFTYCASQFSIVRTM